METHSLQLNEYLLFYVYIFFVFLIANALPVSTINYFIFLFLGIIGISILFIKFTYSVSFKKNIFELFLNIPFKLTLLNLKIEDIKNIEKAKIDPSVYSTYSIKKVKPVYTFKKEDGIKITMLNGESFIIYGVNADEIITRFSALKQSST